MAKYEGSPADEAEDARGMKATGLSKKAYEKSARDKREDRVGEKRTKAPRKPKAAPFGLSTPPGGADDMGGPGADDDMGINGAGINGED